MKKAFLFIALIYSSYSYGQIFKQDFNESVNKRTYIGSGANQFDLITDFRNSKSTIETENGNKFLRFDKIGSSSVIISKNTPLTGGASNNLAYVQFKLRVSGPDVAETPENKLAMFYLGAGNTDAFETNNTAGVPNDNLFSGFGLRVLKADNGEYRFYISPVEKNTFAGWQTITCVANRTGEAITFKAPNGKDYTLQNNKQAIWVGDALQIGSGSLNGGQTTFDKFKLRFTPDYPNLKIDIDDLIIGNSVSVK